mgnify:CR=1 FL=1
MHSKLNELNQWIHTYATLTEADSVHWCNGSDAENAELVAQMPSLPLAIGVLLLRFSISQMDVPTRQSYTMAVVRPEERSAASGITGVARTVGAGILS